MMEGKGRIETNLEIRHRAREDVEIHWIEDSFSPSEGIPRHQGRR
jgi:hypothetical protein